MSRSPVTKSRPREGFSRRDFLTRGAGIALSTPLVAGAGVAEPVSPAADVQRCWTLFETI